MLFLVILQADRLMTATAGRIYLFNFMVYVYLK